MKKKIGKKHSYKQKLAYPIHFGSCGLLILHRSACSIGVPTQGSDLDILSLETKFEHMAFQNGTFSRADSFLLRIILKPLKLL